MEFRTELKHGFGLDPKINFDNQSVFLGSCFAENISQKFDYFKLKNLSNPSGILYNPLSILNLLRRLEAEETYENTDLLEQDGLFKSWEHHSRFNSQDKEKFLESLNKNLIEFKNYLSQSDFVFISFGTAYAYRLKEDQKVVANCHKGQNHLFEKFMPSVEELTSAMGEIIKIIRKSAKPKVQIILTLSPIRHLRDGLVESNLSKSFLRVAMQANLNNSDTLYFPSYELLIDDLRDYRFYASDMTHPNQQALDYIWEFFKQKAIDPNCTKYFKQIDKIHRSQSHRVQFPNSESHLKHLEKIKSDKLELTKKLSINW
jgi:hypothetical protein